MRNFLISSSACPILAYASAGGANTSIKTCRSSFRWKYFASPLFLNSSSQEIKKVLSFPPYFKDTIVQVLQLLQRYLYIMFTHVQMSTTIKQKITRFSDTLQTNHVTIISEQYQVAYQQCHKKRTHQLLLMYRNQHKETCS